jgi:hypothetical protein
MSENEIKLVADQADMIIAGYSFTKDENNNIRILNLENTDEACVLEQDGEMLETTMDDITLLKVQAYYLKNREFMEDINA